MMAKPMKSLELHYPMIQFLIKLDNYTLHAHHFLNVLGKFVNFWVIFWYIWREIVFLKGLVKLMEIGNFEDLLLF